MPTLFLEIPDHANTIRRSSMLGVVLNTLEQLGLDKDYLHYTDVDNNVAQPGTTLGDAQDVKFGSENRIMVEMEERRDSFNLVDRGLGYRFHVPIFKDTKWGILITPACARHNITCNLTNRFKSRGEASEWVNYMHRRVAMFGDVFETEASFHYPIPAEVVTVLKVMYLTGCRRLTPTESFEDYLKRHWHPNVTTLTTDTGVGSQLAVRTTFGRIIVVMEGSGDIVAEKEDDSGAFVAKLSLTYQLDWPEGLKLEYPCMVNNSMIPLQLWHISELPGTANIDSYEKIDVVAAQDALTTHHERIPLPVVMPPIGQPELHTSHRTPSQIDLVIMFIEFGNELPVPTPPEDLAADKVKWLCNLNDLGKVVLSPETIAYIKLSHSTNVDGLDSLIKVYTYRHMYAIHNATFVDENGDVWLRDTEINLEEEYRLSITLELNFKLLTEQGKEHVKNSIPWIIQVIKDFFPQIIPEWPWLFPGWPIDTVDPSHPYWPTERPWLPWANPTWPDDYVEWWVEDELAIGDIIIKPDDTVDVSFDPSHPSWEELIDDVANNSKEIHAKAIHFTGIIAIRN